MRKTWSCIAWLVGVLIAMAALTGLASAQAPIEGELALITPVSKFIHDAALKAFADYAKEKWNVSVKVSAIPAGTPVAYGRIVEWKGRPEVDIVRGGESALFHLDLLYRGRASEAAALGVILILLAAASTVVINRLAGIRMGGVFG
jgi:hypothetical protein